MAEEPLYSLLQAIDPSKIKVPISERFSKLTLSSNKKQGKKDQNIDEAEQDRQDFIRKKRESASRNLLEQLSQQSSSPLKPKNPLLRSESSKDHSDSKTSGHLEDYDTMDPLNITSDDESFDENTNKMPCSDVEDLSQKISALAVVSRPISISSGSALELTQLVSTESQRSSMGDVRPFKNIEDIPTRICKKEVISLPSSPGSTRQNNGNHYEMTDDEDDEEEEDEVITISDSSVSHGAEDRQNEMGMSTLHSVKQTTEILHLPVLSPEKMKRVAAFLRDVSMEQRNREEHGRISMDDMEYNQNLTPQEIETMKKAREMARADTESMTHEDGDECTPMSVLERQRRLKSLGEVEFITPSGHKRGIEEESISNDNQQSLEEDNSIMADLQVSPSQPFIGVQQSEKTTQNNIHRIVSAETQDNTIMEDQKSGVGESSKNKVRPRLASAETVDNTIMTESKPASSANDDHRRLALDETEDNTQLDFSIASISKGANKEQEKCLRIAHDETEVNSSCSATSSPDKHRHKNIAEDETEVNSSFSLTSSPVMKTPRKHLQQSHESIRSIISSSSEHSAGNETAPDHSITILETDDEGSECAPRQSSSPEKSPQSHDNNKLSNSFHNEVDDDSSTDGEVTQIQMSMANINISAKINIKIHIPTSTETSEDDYSTDHNPPRTSSLPDKPRSRETKSRDRQTPLKGNKVRKVPELSNEHEEPNHGNLPSNKSPSSQEEEDDQFVDVAQKLLNQLYGNSWQTPDVMRTLKRTSGSSEKLAALASSSPSSKRKGKDKTPKESGKNKNRSKVVEESVLGDFSMFRRNIVKTNLDSTRLVTPKANTKKTAKENCLTEPRNTRKTPAVRIEREKQFAAPQTEIRKQGIKRTPAMAKISTNQIKSQNEKWRLLVDGNSDSEGNNASDDDDADNSDESWKLADGDLADDSDFELSPAKPKGKSKQTKKNTTNKSQDGLVYLDLSKEEVSVVEDVPESPPANHDDTFASRLNDILKTCRHDDKPKLPSSSQSSKTKRKLFTPMFGHDLEGDDVAVPDIVEKENKKMLFNENESVILDHITCPFDSHGRPKKLEVAVNKQLESVKAGKPIFQLTPSPKKNKTPLSGRKEKNIETPSPKTKLENKSKAAAATFSTRKGEPTKLEDLCRTPDYKYSFLKSLDVTVSKTFCHPDALYYRDNYRTKKEDLSTILYQMYNLKLFSNKLDVPITWNKKLSNTAGRCLNKKKFGIRASVIELSDKVLTSPDRLRCTLIHELCHAATWIIHGEGGHGKTWKDWASRANATFPELPKIGVCHQYDIEYKYTYKCTLCGAKSHAHSKSKKVENIRCSYCHGAIEIFINKKDKDGNIMPTAVREPTGFAKFVKDNYKKYKNDDTKHADVMKILSSEFASMKLTKNGK